MPLRSEECAQVGLALREKRYELLWRESLVLFLVDCLVESTELGWDLIDVSAM